MAQAERALRLEPFLAELAAEAAEAVSHDSARWDAAAFARAVDGPGAALAVGLLEARHSASTVRALVASHLRLCAEAVALGHPVAPGPPHDAGGSFLGVALGSIAPRLLPALSPEAGVCALAALFNLGDNLRKEPPWLERIFVAEMIDLPSLDRLEERAGEVLAEATEPPGDELGEEPRVAWLDTSEADRRFLPGPLHFVSPTVLCVHDRFRGPAGKRPGATCALWLAARPRVLGPSGCAEAPRLSTHQAVGPISRAMRDDPRITEVFANAANAWRAAGSLTTSQMVVALLPRG